MQTMAPFCMLFLPTLIAALRGRPNLFRFFLANFFFGLLPLGGFFLLWRALQTSAPKHRIRQPYIPSIHTAKISFTPAPTGGTGGC